MEPRNLTRVTPTGAIEGDYVTEDVRSDGRLLLRPDLSARSIFDRHGESPLGDEEFAKHFDGLPTDEDQL